MKKNNEVKIDFRVSAPYNVVEEKIENGWGFQRIYKYIRKEKALKKIKDLLLFEILVKEFGRRGIQFTRKTMIDNFNFLIPENKYKSEFKKENIDYAMELSNMYYEEYLKDLKKRPR